MGMDFIRTSRGNEKNIIRFTDGKPILEKYKITMKLLGIMLN